MDDDDSRKRKNHLQLDPPSNSRPATKRKYPLEPEHDESDTIDIVTEDGIPLTISNTLCTTLMDGDSGNETTSSVVDDDLLSMVPLELSYMILSYVVDYKNAMLVCRRWKSLTDDGIACDVLLSREELALIELEPLGVDSFVVSDLVCSEMGLKSIPDSIGALTNLMWCDLSENALMFIPDSIGALTNLTDLRIGSNQLTVIPDTLGSLTNLTRLRLYSNELTCIPDTVGSLTKLERLILHKNQLSTIPDTLGSLTNLRQLWLNNNQLTTIPDTLGSLMNLRELDFINQKSGVKLSRPPLPRSCKIYL